LLLLRLSVSGKNCGLIYSISEVVGIKFDLKFGIYYRLYIVVDSIFMRCLCFGRVLQGVVKLEHVSC
jgi:hypothetical protein